jgi:hypothetical protein
MYLRGRQISEELKKRGIVSNILILNQYDKWYQLIEQIRDSIIIFVKPVTNLEGLVVVDIVNKFRNNGNLMICDLIEPIYFVMNPVWSQTLKKYHVLIAPNESTKEDFDSKCKIVKVIRHHWDARLVNKKPSVDKLRIIHSGTKELNYRSTSKNCLYLDIFSKKNDIKVVNNILDEPDKNEYTCHYSVRDPNSQEARYKSNIKLSNAAALGCNIITTMDESFKGLLNPNYPYLTGYKQEDVERTIEYAKATYGGPIWDRGLQMMENIKRSTSVEVIVELYVKLLEECDTKFETIVKDL